MDKIYPVILSGGSGTRLWPVSRALYPKQLVPLTSCDSLLQQTTARVAGADFADPIIICNAEHRFLVREQLASAKRSPSAIVVELQGRNTAPAVAVAALMLAKRDPDAVMLVMPSDHVVTNEQAFFAAVGKAAQAAAAGALTTFGIHPTAPETGYGYIEGGAAFPGVEGCLRVRRFIEKPERATAEALLASGGHFWNSGIFLFTARGFLRELERFEPTILKACTAAVDGMTEVGGFSMLAEDAFQLSPSNSIDYAVMERTDQSAVVPVDMGWSDVGSWSALWEIAAKDGDGNALRGDVVAHDVANSFLMSDGPLVAAAGIRDVVVVATPDAVLVVGRDAAQDVKKLVDRLKLDGRHHHRSHVRVHRPWGSYQAIDAGERYQVKRITVAPGAALSLQLHHHRAEHWIVVRGTAKVTCGDTVVLVHENQSTYIPIGTAHRLENPGKVQLELIEVQSGAYLGEDDIVRLDDDYGRG